ncbi:gamma-glutamylcyclotransferase family protein [Thiomicrospira sp. ALE5]|uniref:gamma-glutamylcyclotransferase family protein n=1 Tax=Thiomicrospira sp. ALE5 TaxID=748650 RepID=UPI0008F1666B|nr:gamma-glutamylcyclotransferase family protein [Thiomicrospira sp. ALE5]SFR62699.1 Uncharacterized conserved protein YtfP, gamma-glutamylcyclotransferase (GGCT)/AIG2-like family [Thiomicrospira sp. ALE5]
MKIRLFPLLLVSLLPILALSGWLWFNLFSSWGYSPPANLPPITQHAEHRVFVYGTLTHAWVRRLVIGRSVETEPAKIKGYQRQALDLQPHPNASVNGLVFTVSPAELKRLDRYERLGIRYQRVLKTLANGQQAWVYQLIHPPITE